MSENLLKLDITHAQSCRMRKPKIFILRNFLLPNSTKYILVYMCNHNMFYWYGRIKMATYTFPSIIISISCQSYGRYYNSWSSYIVHDLSLLGWNTFLIISVDDCLSSKWVFSYNAEILLPFSHSFVVFILQSPYPILWLLSTTVYGSPCFT